MLKRLLIRWLITAVALGVAAYFVPSVEINGGVFGLIGVAAVFGLINALIGPVVRLLTLPLAMVTFGLFAIVVNGALLALAAGLTDDLDVGGPVGTIVAALAVSVLTCIMHVLVPERRH